MNRDYILRCKRLYSKCYSVYEWLRNNKIEESETSMMLQSPDLEKFRRKIKDEMSEILSVSRGEHIHSDNQRDDMLFEAHQIWYWVALTGVSNDFGYPQLEPHLHIINGFEEGYEGRPDIVTAGPADVISITRESMRFLGSICNQQSIQPHEIAEYDISLMKEKLYITQLFADFSV